MLVFVGTFEWNNLNHPLLHCEVRVHVCARDTDSRSGEDRLLTLLLCLVGTDAPVPFANAMNQRQGGQAGRPKNNQLYAGQIDTRWTGQRGTWRHTPRTNKRQKKEGADRQRVSHHHY